MAHHGETIEACKAVRGHTQVKEGARGIEKDAGKQIGNYPTHR